MQIPTPTQTGHVAKGDRQHIALTVSQLDNKSSLQYKVAQEQDKLSTSTHPNRYLTWKRQKTLLHFSPFDFVGTLKLSKELMSMCRQTEMPKCSTRRLRPSLK